MTAIYEKIRGNDLVQFREAVKLCAHDGAISARWKSVSEYATAP